MDETFASLREALINGISPSESLPANAPYATSYAGMRPSEGGAESLYPVSFPLVGYVQTGHTHLMRGSSRTLLYEFDLQAHLYDTAAPLIDLLVGAKSANDNLTPATLTETGRPCFVEKDGRWFITTGEALITNAGLFSGWTVADSADRPIPSSLCLYEEDRLLMTGFSDSAYFSSSFWLKAWTVWKANSPVAKGIDDSETMSAAYVFYGMPKLGGKDLFSLELALFTGYCSAEFETKVLAAIREGWMGFIKLPWKGTALSILSTQDGAFVYGTDGIGFLSFTEGVPRIDQLFPVGIKSRNSVAGHFLYQGGVLTDGNLFQTDGKTIRPIGYEYLFRNFTPTVSVDELRSDLYINTGTLCYILTPKPALCVGLFDVTSLYNSNGLLYGSFTQQRVTAFTFRSWTLSFKRRAKKMLQLIQLEQEGLSALSSVVEYRHSSGGAFGTGHTIVYNPEGIVTPRVFASDLRVVLTGTPTLKPSNSQVNNLTVHWRTTDKRFIHGLSENTGQELL